MKSGRRCRIVPPPLCPPPRPWMEPPSLMYPIVSNPEHCRFLEDQAERQRYEDHRRLEEFQLRVRERVRDIKERNWHESSKSYEDPYLRPRSASVKPLSPVSCFLERLPRAHSVNPAVTTPRVEEKFKVLTQEEKNLLRFKNVREEFAARSREQARQWRYESAIRRKQEKAKERIRKFREMQEELRLEEERVKYLQEVEHGIVEKQSKLYATELKRLIASRLIRGITATPVSAIISSPYDAENPLGYDVVLSLEMRRVLRRLPALCPCVSDWWETNPDLCQCSLRNNWTECAVGLEKLLNVAVHGSKCFQEPLF